MIKEAKSSSQDTKGFDESLSKDLAHPEEISRGQVTVKLLESDLWEDFHKVGTEMIITKAGR